MADTRIQLEVEDWICHEVLPQLLGGAFESAKMQLSSGGEFEFDAVSKDRSMVASISTSRAKTAGGRGGTGKLMKLRSDMYFLLLVEAERRVMILTEPDMFDRCQAEKARGRVPEQIEFMRVEVPPELNQKLSAARKRASREVRPRRSRKPRA